MLSVSDVLDWLFHDNSDASGSDSGRKESTGILWLLRKHAGSWIP